MSKELEQMVMQDDNLSYWYTVDPLFNQLVKYGVTIPQAITMIMRDRSTIINKLLEKSSTIPHIDIVEELKKG